MNPDQFYNNNISGTVENEAYCSLSKAIHHTSNSYREFITNGLYSLYILNHLHRGGVVSDNTVIGIIVPILTFVLTLH